MLLKARPRPGRRLGAGLTLACSLTALTLLLWSRDARSACVPESTPTPGAHALVRHLGTDCTDQERAARAVSAAEVLAALKEGQRVDLAGVVIAGDLLLDRLPTVPAGSLESAFSPHLQERLRRERLEQVRVITGPIAVRDSIVRGRVTTNLTQGLLVVTGPVVMTGTRFERTLDLSLTAFLGPVDFSEAVFLGEGLFVRTLFERPARFENTVLGGHARFHRSVFGDTLAFTGAGFNGLAELLEVTFEKDASFSRASFKMGAGFSGSRFRGTLDFSEARFEREAFFLHTAFERDASFRQTVFGGRADFSDARFQARDDFSKVLFEVEPGFDRAKISKVPVAARASRGLQDPRVLYVIAAALFAGTLFLLLFTRRG